MWGIYYGATMKGNGKVINIFLFCGGISMFLSVIKTLAKNTGIFAQYLPIIEPMHWIFECILIILIFFFILKKL